MHSEFLSVHCKLACMQGLHDAWNYTLFDRRYCFRQLATILRGTDANLSWQAIKIFNDSFLPLLAGLGGWVYYCLLISIIA